MLKHARLLTAVVMVYCVFALTLWVLAETPQAQAAAPLAAVRDAAIPNSPATYPVVYFQVTPLVVDPSVNEPVQFQFTSDGTVTSMQLALSTGVTVTLSPVGNVFSTTLTHAQVLNGYSASSYQHHLVGRLHVHVGGTDVGPFGVFVNVKDDQVPDVSSTLGGCVTFPFRLCGYKQSAHVVNLWMPTLDPANPSVISVTQRFYQYYGDDYDFLSIIFVPERYANRYHVITKNNVSGIGLGFTDNTATYGSGGRLLGFTEYPLSTYFDMASQASLHEIGHQWINYLRSNELRGVTPHWPISSLAYGMMGWQDASGEGLQFPWTFTPIGSDRYQLAWADYALTYN
ncbi:MAG: hypothetical protein LC737_05510, partial [Chloroflexi bacterium]|nr:hypothetical protein [Chloroflexota bacterium]